MTNDQQTEARNDYLIPVAFDVVAPTREAAAQILSDLLDQVHDHLLHTQPDVVESWWFPEAEDKAIDKNDRPAMHLIYTETGTLQDVANRFPGADFDPKSPAPTVVLDVDAQHRVVVTDRGVDDPAMNYDVGIYAPNAGSIGDLALDYDETRTALDAVDLVNTYISRAANGEYTVLTATSGN